MAEKELILLRKNLSLGGSSRYFSLRANPALSGSASPAQGPGGVRIGKPAQGWLWDGQRHPWGPTRKREGNAPGLGAAQPTRWHLLRSASTRLLAALGWSSTTGS